MFICHPHQWKSNIACPHCEFEKDKKSDVENKSNDSFQWTDENVLELLNAHRSSAEIMGKFWYKQNQIDEFKRFKQFHAPKPQAENKGSEIKCVIEPGMIIEPQIHAGWLEKGRRFKVKGVSISEDKVLFDDFISVQLSALVNDIHDGKFKIIEPQAENKPEQNVLLQNEWSKRSYNYVDSDLNLKESEKPITATINKPDWEIVSVFDTMTNDTYPFNSIDDKGRFKIHSVKRLSDGEVFSVGDEVDSTWGKQKIERFFKSERPEYDDMVVEFATCRNPLTKISKLPPQPQKLFTTEDGVIVKDPERMIFYVSDMRIRERKAKNAVHLNNKRFYDKSKVEEYVLMNKKCFSVNDVIGNLDLWSSEEAKFIELAKQKQTHQ